LASDGLRFDKSDALSPDDDELRAAIEPVCEDECRRSPQQRSLQHACPSGRASPVEESSPARRSPVVTSARRLSGLQPANEKPRSGGAFLLAESPENRHGPRAVAIAHLVERRR
jgi:hypothetical protein